MGRFIPWRYPLHIMPSEALSLSHKSKQIRPVQQIRATIRDEMDSKTIRATTWTNPNKSVQQGLHCLNQGHTVGRQCVHFSHVPPPPQLSEPSISCSVQCAVSSVQCPVCSVQCALHLLCKYAQRYNWAPSLPEL